MNISKQLLVLLALTCGLSTGCRKDSPQVSRELPEVQSQSESPLPMLGQVQDFALIDQSGEPFTRAQLDGKIWIATFIFTRCGLTCPAQTAEFTRLQNYLRKLAILDEVNLVTFTVDPEFDTPSVLLKYGKGANADFENWHFLTGDRNELWELSKGSFKLPVEESKDDSQGLITHSQLFALVDTQANIRGFYAGLSFDKNQKLRANIKRLMNQQFPGWQDELEEVDVPADVRDVTWLEGRAQAQIAQADNLDVLHDFRFTDRIEESGITFKDEVVEDVTREFTAAHYDHGSGVAVADVDGDQKLDVYFVSQFGSNQLWRNLGDGRFEDLTQQAGVGVPGAVKVGASFADVDNDGDADLYVTRVRAPNKLFLNNGRGVFQDASSESKLDHVGHSSGSVFFDYDRDGWLDLLVTQVGEYTTHQKGTGGYYLAHQSAFMGHLYPDRNEESLLLRNVGDGSFVNVNKQVGFQDISWSGDASPIDANDDGWLDIYLLNMQGHDEYYENQQGKSFVKKSRELFPATPWGSMGIKTFDYDRDGDFDLFVTDMHTDMVHDLSPDEEKQKMRRNLPLNALATDGNHVLGNAFYRNEKAATYVEVSDEIGAETYWPWGISVADLNADGFDDVFVAGSMNYPYRYGINSVLLNNGQRFFDSEFILGVEPRSKGTAQIWMELDCAGIDRGADPCSGLAGRALVWAATGTRSSVVFDIEGDGDLDIVTNDFGGTPMVLTSTLAQRHEINYLQLQLQGTKSNRDGLGAVLELHVGETKLLTRHDGKSGYLSQSRMPLYFGLGRAGQVDRIEVTWPSGAKQTIHGPVDANQTLLITEEADSE
jgi:cytochrome oxidase Cu insertion factor (SCO1/SenC/PrrC family)